MEISKTIKIYLDGEDWNIRIVSTPNNADVIAKDGIITVNKVTEEVAEVLPKVDSTYFGNLETDISNLLIRFGIPANIKGYRYTRDAIKALMIDPNAINSVTKILYPDVAEMFDTTPSRVERAIRHAIQVAWTRGDTKLQRKYFNYPNATGKTKPTNSEFLFCIAEQLRLANENTV